MRDEDVDIANDREKIHVTGQTYGIMPSSKYPYVPSKNVKTFVNRLRLIFRILKAGDCKYNANETVMNIKGWRIASCDYDYLCQKANRFNNEEAIAQIVAKYSPVAVSIYVDTDK